MPDRTIGRVLSDRARQTPDRPFLRFGGERLTFSDVEAWSARVAARLAARGVRVGDRVGIMMPNGVEYVVSWLAVVRIGAIVVPINTGYQERDLGFVLGNSGTRLVVTVAGHLPLLDRIWTECPGLEDCVAWDAGFQDEAATGGGDYP